MYFISKDMYMGEKSALEIETYLLFIEHNEDIP